MKQDQPVVVVTGGGGGIGAAIARAAGQRGAFVVTIDPLVSVDGSEQLPAPEETTAGQIVAAGGHARASSASVTDAAAVAEVLHGLWEEFGRLDGVINVAGISRPTGVVKGDEADWRSVLEVHLDGYRNVLAAALPIMARAGSGRIVGVTSGSGWRSADAGAYSCAKRAVAALTWELGRVVPAGVTVNAISPIAMTRMVTAALARARASSGAGSQPGPAPTPAAPTPRPPSSQQGSTGGLSLGSMPAPDDLGPIGAHVLLAGPDWGSGHVLYVGGSEVAVVQPPGLLELVRTSGVVEIAAVLDTVLPGSFVAAETAQASAGGTNPRFGSVFDDPPAIEPSVPASSRCAVVTDDPDRMAALVTALSGRGVAAVSVPDVPTATRPGDSAFVAAAEALESAAADGRPVDAVVVDLCRPGSDHGDPSESSDWQSVLASTTDLADSLLVDAAWRRAAADHARRTGTPVRIVSLVDATTAGGRARAQASAQACRVAAKATDGALIAFTAGLESVAEADRSAAAELTAYLVAVDDAVGLAGAELAVGAGFIGLRSHPRPTGAITFGGPEVPEWLDDALQQIVGEDPS